VEKQQFEFIGKRFDIKNIGKVTGKEIYSCDVNIPGQLYAVVLRSPYPHVEINISSTPQLLIIDLTVGP